MAGGSNIKRWTGPGIVALKATQSLQGIPVVLLKKDAKERLHDFGERL